MAEQAEHLSYPYSDNISVLALRLLSTAGGRKEAQAQPQSIESPRPDDSLQSAIADIEAVIKEYEGEFTK
jgi:hypothetical protein